MSLTIRLSRIGRKGEAKFRVVVKEKRSKRDGRAIDTIGYYERGLVKKTLQINEEKLTYWKSKGAVVSPSAEKAFSG